MDEFKSLVEEVGALLVSKGFKKKASKYYLFEHGNWAVMKFQKSTNSSKEETVFTINLEVVSTRIRSVLDQIEGMQLPEADRGHWKARIGDLLPVPRDIWWAVSNRVHNVQIVKEVLSTVNKFAIPEIEKLMAEDGLKNYWLDGKFGGLTRWEKLLYLTTLLKLDGDSRFEETMNELKEFADKKGNQALAQEHIKKLCP